MKRVLHLDLITVSLSFFILALVCLLASETFRRVYRDLLPSADAADLAVRMVSGLALSIGVLSLLFLAVPASYALFGLAATLVLVAVALWVVRGTRRSATPAASGTRLQDLGRAWRRDFVAPFLVLVTLGYFAWVVVTLRWPPVGDVIFIHGPVTTYLVNGGYPSAYGHLGYFYPVGFHVLPAALVGPFGLYPAEAVFVVGAFVAALIPPLMYRLARQLGAPALLALLAFTAAFVVHPSDNLEQWILGPLYNGPYSNLLGLLLVSLLLVLVTDRFPQGLTGSGFRVYAPAAVVYSIVLAFVYPSFAILVLLDLVVLFLLVVGTDRSSTMTDLRARVRQHPRMVIGVLVVFGLALVGLGLRAPYLDLIWQLYAAPPPDYVAYRLDPSFLTNNPTGVLVLVGIVVALYWVWKRRHAGFAVFYLMTASLLSLSLLPSLYPLIWPILPSRALMILGIAAWPMVLAQVLPSLLQLRRFVFHVRGREGAPWAPRSRGLVIATAVLFVLVLGVQATTDPAVNAFNAPQHYGWYSATPYFESDVDGIAWLAAHAQPHDLILSDGSFISRYALSVGLVNLSNMIPLEFNQTMFDALNYIWAHPTDKNNVTQILLEYDVRYILSTSDWGTYVLSVHQYLPRPFTPQTYATVFDGYSFLTIGFASGDTRVYVVDQAAL